MKNWTMIAIFLAAMIISAAAQQPVTPQSAIINPGEPISIASQTQVLQALPGTLKSHHPRPQPDLKKLTEELNEHQRGLIERHNQQLKERFTALQQAGGWQRVFLNQLALQRLELPNATEQLNAAQQFITNFVFCDRPLIADQTSEFQTFTNNFPLGTLHKEFVVEPLASIIINGCSFGPDAGEIRLVLNQDTGSFLSLQINNWSESSIFATLGANPGIPDQEAQLVVVRKDGTQSVPMPVDFFQHRVAQVFNVANNLSAVSVFTTAHTTQDQFRFVTFTATGNSDIAASHYTFCCSAVSGTDGWLFKLKNNWEIPNSNVFRVTGFDTAAATSVLAFQRFDLEDGITDCGIFGSDEGGLTGVSVINNPTFFPDFQTELNISWEAGAHCSGFVYFMQVVIWGPDGVPFE
jgi:hypothetical protein